MPWSARFDEPIPLPNAANTSTATHRQISFRPSVARFGIYGTVRLLGRRFRPAWEDVMTLSSSFVAPSAVAILSTVLLWGPAASQTGIGSPAPLPSITVDAPKHVAR